MAKTIKFNLILDNYPVRNIEGLQEHFSIEDMLKYFKNGLLLRWLDVRGYKTQYDAVAAINQSSDKKEIVMALVKIFEVAEMEIADIEKAIGILTYLDEEKELNAIYKENAFSKKQIITDYHSGYIALIMHMEENKDNMAILKADAMINEINELAHKSKTVGLTEEEKARQHELRQEYLRIFRSGFQPQLKSIKVVDSEGHFRGSYPKV